MDHAIIVLTVMPAVAVGCYLVLSMKADRRREWLIRDWARDKGYAVISLTRQATYLGWSARMLGPLGSSWTAKLQDEQGGQFSVAITFKRGGKMDVEKSW